jgi:hypothetical protein
MPADVTFIFYCPRCPKEYKSNISMELAEKECIKHVSGQHPDHDPNWYDTASKKFGN